MINATRKFLLAAAVALAATASALADCGFPEVTVEGNEQEIEVACKAVREVKTYFDALGFTADGQVTVSFEKEVLFGLGDGTFAQVLGCYDRRAKRVELTSWEGDTSQLRKPWGIQWGRELAYSIAHHELAHWATGIALEEEYSRLPGPWHEFIAYSVQFELMDAAMLQRILANYSNEVPFRTTSEVNEVLWAAAPDAFAVRSYLYQQKHGGSRLVEAIIRGHEPVGSMEPPLLCK